MPSRADIENHSRLILGLGMMGLGAVWLLRLIWPILLLGLLGGLIIGGYWILQRQQAEFLRQQRREDRLARKFYELLDYRQGRISSLEFAMYTRINGREAQRYLHAQAQAFGGFFERAPHNDTVYIFNPAVIYSYMPQSSMAHAPMAHAPMAQNPMSQGYRQHQPATPAETAWTQAAQASVRKQLTSSEPAPLPTVRGQAHSAENIKTIDVTAVNE